MKTILICNAGSCQRANSQAVMAWVKTALQTYGLEEDVTVSFSDCLGYCKQAPVIKVCTEENLCATYVNLTEQKVREICREHVRDGKVLSAYAVLPVTP